MSFINSSIFKNIAIKDANKEIVVTNTDNNNNVSFHASNSDDNVDTVSIKNILNKASNMDLNICSFNNNILSPVITINNNNLNCEIKTILNMNNKIISNVGYPDVDGDAVNLEYYNDWTPTDLSELPDSTNIYTTRIWLQEQTSLTKKSYVDTGTGFNTNSDLCLEIGKPTTIGSANSDVYPVIKIHPPNNSSGPWLNYVQDNSSESMMGWAWNNTPIYEIASNKNSIFHGKMGIGIANPQYYLHVAGSNNHMNTAATGWTSVDVSAKFEKAIIAEMFIVASDNRIKCNIVDVQDNLALEQLRKIPCRYYEYIDKLDRGSDKTIGFIAQEVKTVMSIAVSEHTNFIPDIYKKINCIWTNINNEFIMSSINLSNVSGIKYKFYVSNESNSINGINEKMVEIIGNIDNTFTFDTQYINVFCYGKEVDDFNMLDKDKLFTLNFAASQKLDKIQQTHIIEIASLTTENQQQQTEINTLKTENQQQQTEINTLKTENIELKSIIDKLKTSNSFEEFREKLL